MPGSDRVSGAASDVCGAAAGTTRDEVVKGDRKLLSLSLSPAGAVSETKDPANWIKLQIESDVGPDGRFV
jgi:hypothetical protein